MPTLKAQIIRTDTSGPACPELRNATRVHVHASIQPKSFAPLPWRVCVTAILGLTLAVHGQTRLEIDAARPGPRVNPQMYGIFFEELSHAGDGGLYAEMVRNRSFEDNTIPEGMHLQNGKAVVDGCRKQIPWPPDPDPVPGWRTVGSAAMEVVTDQPLNDRQVHSLKVTFEGGKSGVANSGFWGMSVTETASYNLALYARCEQFKGTLTAVLEDAAGKPLGEPVRLQGAMGAAWNKLSGELRATATCHNARLSIYADGPGTAWLDVVSLFPKNTYANRPNGLRPDLVQMLRDLKPGFLRFPGGCVVEGLTLEQGFHWKQTIGDIARRPGCWNAMWGYRRSEGLGYHELLQLCEDIGAAPMFTLNVGVACTIHTNGPAVPMDRMQEVVQDALDAIEYANGPADSTWGAQRAKNGHPAPFGMRYVNIGNELHNDAYAKRYPLFYDAIKKRYPEITTVAYAALNRSVRNVEMRDLHDYRDDAWFLKNMARFDSFPRDAMKWSCMELAVRNHTNHTLHNALLEAAYMIGMERNADVMRLVSYAPLLLNVSHKGAWEPDLIHFNQHQVFGTPSYYVQMLFMHHRPDVVLPAQLSPAPPSAGQTLYVLAGRDEKAGQIIIKVVNLADAEQALDIAIAGVKGVAPEATAIVLASGNPMDKNSFEQPRKVSPATSEIRIGGPTFRHSFPKHSVTVLRITVKT